MYLLNNASVRGNNSGDKTESELELIAAGKTNAHDIDWLYIIAFYCSIIKHNN